MLAKYTTPRYGDGYVYSTGAVVVGVFCGMIPILGMLAVAIQSLIQTQGSIFQVYTFLTSLFCFNNRMYYLPQI